MFPILIHLNKWVKGLTPLAQDMEAGQGAGLAAAKEADKTVSKFQTAHLQTKALIDWNRRLP
jgi:hypothetical protein